MSAQIGPVDAYEDCTIRVLAYTPETTGEPHVSPHGGPAGAATTVGVEKLLRGLAAFAEKAGQTLNDLEVPPSSFTLEGNVSVEAGANVGLTFGVTVGIGVSMTWDFSTSSTQTRPGPRPLIPDPPQNKH